MALLGCINFIGLLMCAVLTYFGLITWSTGWVVFVLILLALENLLAAVRLISNEYKS